MNSNKFALNLNRVFCGIFAFNFILLFIWIIFFGYEKEINSNTYNCIPDEHFQIALTAIIMTIALSLIYYFWNTRFRSDRVRALLVDNDLNTRRTLIIGVLVMLLIQLVVAYFLQCKPVTDLEIIRKHAMSFAETGRYELMEKELNAGYAYFYRYPNNWPILFFWSYIFRASYLLTGGVNPYMPVVINTIAINVSVLLAVLLAQKIYGNKKAIFTFLICFLFMPYYTYTPFYYTDSLSMPLVMGGIYILYNAVNSDTKYKKYVLMAVSGVVLLLGFKFKASVIFIVIAAVIYMFLSCSFKRFAALSLALLVGFGSSAVMYKGVTSLTGVYNEELSEKYEFPSIHWVMMGLQGLGYYHPYDSDFTAGFPDRESKKQGDMIRLEKRINMLNNPNPGEDSMLDHIFKKAVWTWEDGSYYASHHISEPLYERNWLHDLVIIGGKNYYGYYCFVCGIQLFLIFCMIRSAIKSLIRPKIDFTILFKGVIFGAFIFFIIWETRARYLFNFTPLFILLACDGLDLTFEGDFKRLDERDYGEKKKITHKKRKKKKRA